MSHTNRPVLVVPLDAGRGPAGRRARDDLGLAVGCTRYLSTLARPEEPVVLDGSALPKLAGIVPQHVVGFSWDTKKWNQIPTQVDQRDWVNPGQILNRPASAYAEPAGGADYKVLVYTNPATPAPGLLVDPDLHRRGLRQRPGTRRRGLLPVQRRRRPGARGHRRRPVSTCPAWSRSR